MEACALSEAKKESDIGMKVVRIWEQRSGCTRRARTQVIHRFNPRFRFLYYTMMDDDDNQ